MGVVAGAGIMMALPLVSPINGYLYPLIGVSACYVIGWVASQVLPRPPGDLAGLVVRPCGARARHEVNRHASA